MLDAIPQVLLVNILLLLPLSDRLALLLTNKHVRKVTQPRLERHRRLLINISRNWKIRVLPGSLSQTRREIVEAYSQIIVEHDLDWPPCLLLVLTLGWLTIWYRTAPPTLMETMLALRVRRALRRSNLSDIEGACFFDGLLDLESLQQYLLARDYDIKPKLIVFLNDLFLSLLESVLVSCCNL